MNTEVFFTAFEQLLHDAYTEEEVGHGMHWRIFFDDMNALIRQLPTAAEEGEPVTTCADDPNTCPLSFPDGEPEAVMLAWPSVERGMIQLLQTDAKGEVTAFASAYPWASDGVTHMAQLQGIRLWPGRLEAHVEIALGEAGTFTFFDALFARNRVFYRQGGFYPFVLTGFAYTVSIENEPSSLIVEEDMSRSGSVMNLIPDGPLPDDYHFVGRVKHCSTIRFFDRPVLLARIRMGYFTLPFEEDFDLDVIITDLSLRFGREPEVGDWVTGRLWLTGHLRRPSCDVS